MSAPENFEIVPADPEVPRCGNPRCGESFPGQITLKHDGAHIFTAPCPDCQPTPELLGEEARKALADFDDHGDYEAPVEVLRKLIEGATQPESPGVKADAQTQLVTVHRCADRHADLHTREFAETHEVVVPAGPPHRVVASALAPLDLPVGRYAVTIDWPFDQEETPQPESPGDSGNEEKWCGECGLQLTPTTPPSVWTGHIHKPVAAEVMEAAWSLYAVVEATKLDNGESEQLTAATEALDRKLKDAGITEMAVHMYGRLTAPGNSGGVEEGATLSAAVRMLETQIQRLAAEKPCPNYGEATESCDCQLCRTQMILTEWEDDSRFDSGEAAR
jgi:hypothetical protein